MRIGVVGAQTLGSDLVYGFVTALSRDPKARVFFMDSVPETLERGVARIGASVEKALARGKLRPKAAAAVEGALVATSQWADLGECDYVLEAAAEELSAKQELLAKLESVVSRDCLIGCVTSVIPRASIVAKANHPGRCFVNRLFHPAWRALPVEVVLSEDEAMSQRLVSMLKRLGKVPVVTADVPCFATGDIFSNYVSEAARIVSEGRATPAEVDHVVERVLGTSAPFRLMDATLGNGSVVAGQRFMQEAEGGTVWFSPPTILEQQGETPWFRSDERTDPVDIEPARATEVRDRLLAVLIGRSYAVVEREVCGPTELNWMTRTGFGFRRGLLEWAEDLGIAKVHSLVTSYADKNLGFVVPDAIRSRALVSFRKEVRVERDGRFATIRVFRPEVKNALSRRAIEEIDDAFRELEEDTAVEGIVFTSFDGSLAGADIRELAALPDAAALEAMCIRTHAVMRRMTHLNKPVVAALDGPVMGGGAEFSMACHARVVGPKLVMSQPEVNLGLIPGYGGTQRLPRLVGIEKANVMLRAGTQLDAEGAIASGWAMGPVAVDVEAAAREVLEMHLAGTRPIAPVDERPMTVPEVLSPVDIGHRSRAIDAIATEVLLEGLKRPLDEGLSVEAHGFGRCRNTQDTEIGLKNFIDNGPRVAASFVHA